MRVVGVVPLMIWGYSVTPVGARRIVATLIGAGDADSLSAAAAISRAIDDDGGLVGLEAAEGDAVFFALVDDGGAELIAELRGPTSVRTRLDGRRCMHRYGSRPPRGVRPSGSTATLRIRERR